MLAGFPGVFACCRGQDLPSSLSGLVSDLCFYVPFDDDGRALVAGGVRTVSPSTLSLVEGKSFRAVNVTSAPIQTYHPGNFNAAAGTVAFWTRPDWLDDRDEDRNRQFFRCKWVNLNYSGTRGILFFMTGDVGVPQGFEWDYSVSSTDIRGWRTGDWHHIAFSWNASTGRKALYLDGRRAASGTTSRLSASNEGNAPVRLGISASGAYDEWMIWERELADDEVSLLVSQPELVSRHVRAVCCMLSAGVSVGRCPLDFAIPPIKPPVSAVVEPGSLFTARFGVRNRSAVSFGADLRFSLLDFGDCERGFLVRRVDLASGQSLSLALPFECPAETGVFKVAVHVPGADGPWFRDVSAFASWPLPDGLPDPESFFGNHVNSWFGGAYIRQAARLGLGWVRNHDMLQATWWGHVQPDPGEFQWLLEDHIDTCVSHHMPILGALTGTPWWAVEGGPKEKTKPGRGFSHPPKPELWRTYCRETLRHYKDRIRFWEIYNEPAVSMFWKGTPQQHAELVRIACEEARAIDPSLVLMASGYTYPSWRWHEENARAGAWKDLDILSIHITAFDVPETAARHLALNLAHFRDLLERYGPGRETPIWSTEGGMGDTTWFRGLEDEGLPPERLRPPLSSREGAIRVVQGSAIMQAQGIERHFIYLHNLPKRGARAYQNTCMIDINNAPRPKLLARVAMAAQLDGTRYAGDVHRLADARFWAFVFARREGNGSVVLWWVGDEGSAAVSIAWPGPVEGTVDLMGNPGSLSNPVCVTGVPSYVHVDAPAASVLSALREARISVRSEPVPLPDDGAAFRSEAPPGVPPLPDYVAPSENPAAVFTVDVRGFCTMGFADPVAGDGRGGWSDEGPMNDMRHFPTGRRRFYGVPFDVIDPGENAGKSVVTLRGSAATRSLPIHVAIPIGPRRVRCLYILHAAAWGSPGEIGSYRVDYTDGTGEQIANVIPDNNGNWWTGWQQTERSKPVAVRVSNTATGKAEWRYVRVFEWENPHPGKIVNGIHAVSAARRQTPILIAISGVGY